MSNAVILDAGNAIIKAKNSSKEIKFAHAIRPITEKEWALLEKRGIAQHPDYIRVNGEYFCIGETAEQKSLKKVTFKTGAARYTKEYYGVFVAASLARLYSKSMKNVYLFASHAPGDYMFRDNMLNAAYGTWEVEAEGKVLTFGVEWADSFEEPNGGASNLLYTEDGTKIQNLQMKRGTTLVIDIGGHTTDFLIVHPGGRIEVEESKSLPGVGINSVLDALQDGLKTAFPDFFQNQNVFHRSKLRDALRSGKYDAGGYGMLDCTDLADQASIEMLNEIANQYQNYGGTSQFNHVVLTGGGGGTQERRVRTVLEHPRVILADHPATIEFANVRGGMKLFKVYETQGLLND